MCRLVGGHGAATGSQISTCCKQSVQGMHSQYEECVCECVNSLLEVPCRNAIIPLGRAENPSPVSQPEGPYSR